MACDWTSLEMEIEMLMAQFTREYKDAYNIIIKFVDNNNRGRFFIYGYGGTGKTYVWRTLSASIRSKWHIVLIVAPSGIASLLLTGGCTVHLSILTKTQCVPVLSTMRYVSCLRRQS